MSAANDGGRRVAGAAMGAAAFAGVIGILLAGCSGGTGSSNAAATGTSTVATNSAAPSSRGAVGARADFQAYTGCLQQHGVKLPIGSARPFASGSRRPRPSGSFVQPNASFSRPPGGFGGAPGGSGGFLGSATADPATQAALKACASLLPQGEFGRGGGQAGAISAATYAAFKSCMSDNGVTLTATDAQAGLRGLDRSDPKTAAALKICQPIVGTAGRIGAAGSSVPSPSPSPSPS